ncbi:hypothetical protein GCM10025298_31900 [Natronobiforma cellulositropha]
MLALPLAALAGCLDDDSGSTDEDTEMNGGDDTEVNGNDGTDDDDSVYDPSDDAGEDDDQYTEYLDLIFYLADPEETECDGSLSREDERIDGVRLFQEAFDDLEEHPPDSWYYGGEIEEERIAATVSPDSSDGEEAAAAYKSLYEDDGGVRGDLPRSMVRTATAASGAGDVTGGTIPCIEYDDHLIAVFLRWERED